MTRTSRLCRLMADHDLKPRHIARLLGVSPSTVYAWRTESHPQEIPPHKLRLLEVLVEQQSQLAAIRAEGMA